MTQNYAFLRHIVVKIASNEVDFRVKCQKYTLIAAFFDLNRILTTDLGLILFRSKTGVGLETAAEILGVTEATGVSHVGYSLVALAEQLAGMFYAGFAEKVLRGDAHGLAKFALQT